MQLVYISLAFIASAVSASPHYGYSYNRNTNHNYNTNNNLNSLGSLSGLTNLGNSQQHSNTLSNKESFFNPTGGNIVNTVTHQSQKLETGFSGDKYLPPGSPQQEPLVTKQFFLVSAPEDPEDAPRTKHVVIGRPQKNYRVVFIKAPSSSNANLKFTAEYAPQEEKTVIYVLSKKDNELNIGEIATPEPTQPPKPEVFFIKYKTPEEAAAAQKEIQEQYDHLGGTTEFSDQGVGQIKSVIGSLDGVAANGGYDYKKIRNGGNSAIKDFLPPPPASYYF